MPRDYVLAGLVFCGICGRLMDSHWVHDRASYLCRIELAPKACEAFAPGLGDEVRVGLRRERGERELAHRCWSSVGVR